MDGGRELAGARLPLSRAGVGSSPCLTRSPRLVPSPIPRAYLSPDGSQCHGLRWRRCRSPRSDSRSQESGGADTATVSEGTVEEGRWGLGPRGGEVGLGTQTPGSGLLIRASGEAGAGLRSQRQSRRATWLHPCVFLGAQISVLGRSGAGETRFVGPHVIRDRVELLPVPGAGHGCRQLPGRGGERPRPSRHLGSQPPGPAAWRVSNCVAGVGEPWGRSQEHPGVHSPLCLAEARTCWSWWPRFELGTGIRSLCRCPACCPGSGPGGWAKRVCVARTELGERPALALWGRQLSLEMTVVTIASFRRNLYINVIFPIALQ